MSRVSRLAESLLVAFTVVFFGVGVTSYAQPNDEAQLRVLEQRFAEAFKAKDVDGIMANYEHSQNLVFFDVVPRREYTGWDAYRQDWQGFLASLGPVTLFEVKDLRINVKGNLAYSSSFQHYLATTKGGESRDVTVRVTDVYGKNGGRWLIVQEHVSVPVDPQTGKGDLQSKPQE
jgi:ketosteroid isomerase-like protein